MSDAAAPAVPVYDVDYFIAKFSAIPEEKWTEGQYLDERGKCCALGHCGFRGPLSILSMPKIASREALSLHSLLADITTINDGCLGTIKINDRVVESQDLGPTPRARVLAALQILKDQSAETAK